MKSIDYLLTQQENGQPQTEEKRPLELVVGHIGGAGGRARAGGKKAGQCACAAAVHHTRVISPHSAPQTLDTVD